jgi:hypothetical protein
MDADTPIMKSNSTISLIGRKFQILTIHGPIRHHAMTTHDR